MVIGVLSTGMKIIAQEERGIYMRFGKYVRILNPGMNFVAPLIGTVVKMNLKMEDLGIPRQEIVTKDRRTLGVNGVIQVRVLDPAKAFFTVTNYRASIVYLAEATIRRLIGEMTYDEALSSRNVIDERLRRVLVDTAANWGVKVETALVREIGPAGSGISSTVGQGMGIPQGRMEHGAFKVGR